MENAERPGEGEDRGLCYKFPDDRSHAATRNRKGKSGHPADKTGGYGNDANRADKYAVREYHLRRG